MEQAQAVARKEREAREKAEAALKAQKDAADRKAKVKLTLTTGTHVKLRAVRVASRHVRVRWFG